VRKLNEFTGYGRSSTVSGEWKRDEKLASKVFQADWDKINKWQDKHSGYWTKESVDFDNESGLYVIIDRFQALEAPSHRLQDLRSWGKIANVLKHFDIKLPRVIGVKIDNHWNARPQSGINKADAVFEIPVEANLTRFIAVFHDSDADYLGPMRSGRPTDPTVLAPLNATFIISGAQPWVQRSLWGMQTMH